MVEVFKTNVEFRVQADMLVKQIHKTFPAYTANFDLEDCDKILRVRCILESVDASLIIHLLNRYGFVAEVLDDNLPSIQSVLANLLSVDPLK